MNEQNPQGGTRIPLLQRFYDSPFLLLLAGIVVMFILFTGWGMFEILTLPQATLP
jgi:hypothetical protein